MATPRSTIGSAPGSSVSERARILHDAARLTCETAARARTSIDWSLSLTTFDDVGWTGARVGLIACGDGYVLVEASGEIDIASRGELRDLLDGVVAGGAHAVVVDLTGVSLLSAAGFDCLHRAATRLASRRGRLHVVCPAGRPAERVMRLLAQDTTWPVHADVATALAAVAGRPVRPW